MSWYASQERSSSLLTLNLPVLCKNLATAARRVATGSSKHQKRANLRVLILCISLQRFWGPGRRILAMTPSSLLILASLRAGTTNECVEGSIESGTVESIILAS